MKRLLLLFVLCPIVLFGQARRKAIADSIKAQPVNLQSISEIISNNPGIRVEHTDVSDSGEYVTLLVRIHVNETMAVISSRPLAKIETGTIVEDVLPAVTIPHLPRVVGADTILALTLCAVLKFNTAHIPVIKLDTATLSPLPDVANEEIEKLPVLAITLVRIDDIAVRKVGMITIPDVELVIIEALTLSSPVQLTIADPPVVKIDTLAVPRLEEKKMPVEEMHLSEVGYSLLEKLEGFSPTLYALRDGGLTIGFGFFVPYGEKSMWNKGVTWEDAELLIRQKVPVYEDQVKQYINVPLTQSEFDALTMLAYNLGGFSKATSIVSDINMQAGLAKLQSDWKRFVHSKAPGVARGLMNRRKDELGVKDESDYQPERKIQILKN